MTTRNNTPPQRLVPCVECGTHTPAPPIALAGIRWRCETCRKNQKPPDPNARHSIKQNKEGHWEVRNLSTDTVEYTGTTHGACTAFLRVRAFMIKKQQEGQQ